ncbi:MAG: hypothetical protein KC912_06210 [Proteobacteria bacterium]|nr:hypothetical protein [Pseudomonadota bacterium]
MRTLLPMLILVACGDTTEEPPADPTGCNGADVLCERRFDELVVAMTHNGMSSAEDDWLAPNQTHGMARQLEDGVRGFMLDTHYGDGDEALLCHGFCGVGSMPLVEGLSIFTSFLEANPREVITFMFEADISAEDTAKAFDDAGLTPFTYAHDPSAPWPTLETLIAAETRAIVFHQGGTTEPAWYMAGYSDFVWDTDYAADTAADFSCDRLRGNSEHSLFLMNHFLTSPLASADLAEQVNHNPLLLDRAEQCALEAGQPVNWIAVDFYDIGDVLETVDILNGATE